VLLPPGGCLGRLPSVSPHLLIAAVLAAEGGVPSVHEDVAVAGEVLAAGICVVYLEEKLPGFITYYTTPSVLKYKIF
jgi:hypothetical protein